MGNTTNMSPTCSQKCYFFKVCWKRHLKWKNTFGLHRRERIEVWAILKTVKKRPKHDMQTNTHTHTRLLWKSSRKALNMEYCFRSRTASFFMILTLGPRLCQKRPQSCPWTAKVPQMVAQRCTKVSKGCGNGAPKWLKAWQYHHKGSAMTQTSVLRTITTQKHTTWTKKETNKQTHEQAIKQTSHKKTQNKRLRPVADCRAASLDIYNIYDIYIYYIYMPISLLA